MDGEVDLDDPKIYEYLPKTVKELDQLMFREIGYAIVYMDYFPSRAGIFPKNDTRKRIKDGETVPRVSDASYAQRIRVQKLIKKFATDRSKNYDNLQWYKEQVFLFQDETENMC